MASSNRTPTPKNLSADLPKPQLKTVLSNLNVHLEDELMRYRRQLRGQAAAAKPAPAPSLDLISVKASAAPPPPPNPLLVSQTALPEASAAPAPPEVPAPDLALHPDQVSPESYLASSEALLQSLAEERLEPEAPEPPTPVEPYHPGRRSRMALWLGLLLLLLVSSLGLGYVMMNPAVLSPLRNWVKARLPEAAETPSAPAPAEEPPADRPLPDLSTREFVELDLENLSTLDINSTGTPPSLSTPIPGQSGLPTDGTVTTPVTPPAPLPPSPVPPSPAPTSAVPVGTSYYVIADYTGDASLAQVRTVVSDAFVRAFKPGSRIQVGAFDNAASAEQFVQALKQRGVTAQVYGPTDE
jgi:hypothetical protein